MDIRTTGPTRFVFMVDDRSIGPERFTFGDAFEDLMEVVRGFRQRGGFVGVPSGPNATTHFEGGSVGRVVRVGCSHDFEPQGVTWKK